MSDVALFFPPHCESGLRGPHLALPQLRACLEAEGFEAKTADLNVGFFRWKTEPRQLSQSLARLIEAGAGIAERQRIDRDELDRLLVAAEAEELLSEIEQYAPDAMMPDDLFNRAVGLLSDEIYRVPLHFEEIIAAVESEEISPFDAYYDSLEFTQLVGDTPVLGISVAFHLQLFPALLLAFRLHRAMGGNRKIILGGSQISLMTRGQLDQLLQLPFVSAIVLHEGEIPLLEIARQGAGVDFSTIPNVLYEFEGKVLHSSWHTPASMAKLPTPSFEPTELPLYNQPPVLPVYVSKGCYWGKCKFCDYTKLYTPGQAKTAGWSTFRPAEKLVDDMFALQRQWSSNQFYLVSEAITPSYYRRLAKQIVDRRLHAQMSSYCRVEKGNSYEFFKLLHRAGVRSLTFGVEATNDRVLELIDKGNTVEQIETTIRAASSAGITVVFNLIPDYPTTTWEEARQTMRFVEENLDFISIVNPQFFDLSSNSSINDELEEHGLEVSSSDPIRTNHGVHSIQFERDKGLTEAEAAEVRVAYHRLFGDAQCHRRVREQTQLVSHADFAWERARFLFDERTKIIATPFDLAANGQHYERLGDEWVLLFHRELRRMVVAPAVVGTAIGVTYTLGPCTLGEMIAAIGEEWEINDAGGLENLLKQGIMTLIRNGLMRDVKYPGLVLA